MRNWTKASAKEPIDEDANEDACLACRRSPSLASLSRILPKEGIGRSTPAQADRSAASRTAKPLRLSEPRLAGQEAVFLPHGGRGAGGHEYRIPGGWRRSPGVPARPGCPRRAGAA